MGGWLQFGREEVGWGRRRRKQMKRGRESVGGASIYWIFQRNHRRQYFVGDSAGVSDTSLFGCPGLNPSVFPSVNSSEKNPRHPAVAIFKKNFSPSAMPPVYTDGIIPSVYTSGIADGVFPSGNSNRFGDGIISVGNFCRRK